MIEFQKNKWLPKFTKLVTYLVIFWILVLLGRSLWQNWQLKSMIWQLEEQITTLKAQKKDLENLNLYYSSDSFRELEARKRLGLKKANEKMVILPAASSSPKTEETSFPEQLAQEKEKIVGNPETSKIPNWLLWWQYFTK